MYDPLKEKYHQLYWDIAYDAAKQSVSTKRKVGAIIVTPSGMLSVGWNGTPAGFDNACEDDNNFTKPEVIHAERNALDKMHQQGVSVHGSILFVTCMPCLECAKAIHNTGLRAVHYDQQKRNNGLAFLRGAGIKCYFRFGQKYREDIDRKAGE